MGKNPDSQRKSPQQGRSKALVDAIYEATVRILPAVGSAKITTKKIADMAGVSVGSFYQYFPNKDAVLAAVIDATTGINAAEVEKKLAGFTGESIEELTGSIVDFVVDLCLSEKSKLREIFLKAPELGRLPKMFKMRQAIVEKIALEIERLRPGLERADYVRISFIAANSVMGVVQTMLYDQAQTYSNEELSRELRSMLNAYFVSRTA